MRADEIYVHCDQLEKIPALNRENWLWESTWLCEHLKPNARVLQIGSCEGSRLIDLSRKRPDLAFTRLEIDPVLHEMALDRFGKTQVHAKSVLGDITKRETIDVLGHFDYAICLNNTLGYIPDEETTLANMKHAADTVIISVYGEKFTDDAACAYFATLTLDVEDIIDDVIHVKNFGTVKRYRRGYVERWNGKIAETPLGYLCVINA